eukprot:CAMPEP_0184676194 /NCGR_PEP_ID=MMETSP0308-20130426/88219_1 /TAXON_ID=38269 /ORGANISM="Gloeochaete witrockiana, Strain SAG 46.84" /LENGTH=47 /DNA_ID= /DNA_START= /DNA_END= /DNA_ORIENTATION=
MIVPKDPVAVILFLKMRNDSMIVSDSFALEATVNATADVTALSLKLV